MLTRFLLWQASLRAERSVTSGKVFRHCSGHVEPRALPRAPPDFALADRMIMQFQAVGKRHGVRADRIFRIQIHGFRVNIRKIVFRQFFGIECAVVEPWGASDDCLEDCVSLEFWRLEMRFLAEFHDFQRASPLFLDIAIEIHHFGNLLVRRL